MIKKIKEIFLHGEKLAAFYEKNGELENAYREYIVLHNYIKAGEMMQRLSKWHEASGLYILGNDVTRARKAIEICFKKNKNWEVFPLLNGQHITIEEWLKRKGQTRRFVRYIKDVNIINGAGMPILVHLADKLKSVFEFKSAAELYESAFYILNENIREKAIVKNEMLLKHAAENYARVGLPDEAARCVKELIVIEVEIGEKFLKNSKTNPYRDYIPHLKWASQLGFLTKLVELLADFDPFRIAYDLLKIDAVEMSIDLFFRYYGKVSEKAYNELELQSRNEKIDYCLTQYVVYYSDKKNYLQAAKIAQMNSQTGMANELFRKAGKRDGGKSREIAENKGATPPGVTKAMAQVQGEVVSEPVIKSKTTCRECGEELEPQWGVCPGCGQVLQGALCACGKKIKSHWVKCPNCLRPLVK